MCYRVCQHVFSSGGEAPADKLMNPHSESVSQRDMTDRPVCCVSHMQPDHTLFIALIMAFHPFLSLHLLAFYFLYLSCTLLIYQHTLATKASLCLTATLLSLSHPQHLTVSTFFMMCTHFICMLPLATCSSFLSSIRYSIAHDWFRYGFFSIVFQGHSWRADNAALLLDCDCWWLEMIVAWF